MKEAACLVVLGLLSTAVATGADSSGCGISKGLYEGWLAQAKHAPTRTPRSEALVEGVPAPIPDPDRRQSIGREYQAFFRCLSDTAEQKDREALQVYCRETEGDRLASLVCRTALYLKGGRADGKELVDALPGGRKGAELVWDLEEIAGPAPKQSEGALFLPGGPAYKLIDELFLLVLDDRDMAAAKYFNIAAYATAEGARHMDEQIKLLLRESPSVVVKKWVVLRQYQPKLKKLLSEMTASLPKAELQKMRQGLGAFCSKDNPDCPEILRLFGRPE